LLFAYGVLGLRGPVTLSFMRELHSSIRPRTLSSAVWLSWGYSVIGSGLASFLLPSATPFGVREQVALLFTSKLPGLCVFGREGSAVLPFEIILFGPRVLDLTNPPSPPSAASLGVRGLVALSSTTELTNPIHLRAFGCAGYHAGFNYLDLWYLMAQFLPLWLLQPIGTNTNFELQKLPLAAATF
jgi:hypothetical protein